MSQRDTARSRWLDAGCVVLFALALVLTLRAVTKDLAEIGEPGRPASEERNQLYDWRDVVYTPVRDLLDGENPYEGDAYLERHPGQQVVGLYAPGWFLLATPFALVPWEVSAGLALALNAVLAIVLVDVVLRAAGRSPRLPHLFGLAALVLASPAGFTVHRVGQPVLVVAIGSALAVHWGLSGRKPAWLGPAGVALALVKPQFGVPLCLLLGLGFGAWRLVARGVGIAAAVSAPVALLAMVNAGGPGALVDSVADSITGSNAAEWDDLSTSGTFYRIDGLGWAAKMAPDVVSAASSVLVLALAVGAAAWALRRAGYSVDMVAEHVLVIGAAVLVALPHGGWDAAYALWPLLFAVAWWAPRDIAQHLDWRWVMVVAGVVLLRRPATLDTIAQQRVLAALYLVLIVAIAVAVGMLVESGGLRRVAVGAATIVALTGGTFSTSMQQVELTEVQGHTILSLTPLVALVAAIAAALAVSGSAGAARARRTPSAAPSSPRGTALLRSASPGT